ncbi:MAG TPA: anti-sigma factor [Gaiellaceae bacterium]|nr:anti-sigma factor [Gaiellaceae bacterium]
MSERRPDFDELVGSDIGAGERERLLRAHEALASVGPPPELSPRLSVPPATEAPRIERRRKPWRAAALVAALAVTVFAIGVAVGDRADGPGTFEVLAMTGTESAPQASASLEVFDADAAGNWPIELSIADLPPTDSGRPYELWLTRDGVPYALCGSFLAEPDGTTTVPMNAPYKLTEFDAWVIVEQGSEEVLLTT